MVESIIANPLVRKVNFTGSTRVGSIVGALCGKYIKPSVLELGGAAVFITLEDADLELAAKNAVYGSFFHSGQICMSTNNILGEEYLRALNHLPRPIIASTDIFLAHDSVVHESVAGKFIQALQREMQNVRAGPSSNPTENVLRGVFSDSHASRVSGMVNDAIRKGAKVIVGDPAAAGKFSGGNVLQPLILDGVKPSMRTSPAMYSLFSRLHRLVVNLSNSPRARYRSLP